MGDDDDVDAVLDGVKIRQVANHKKYINKLNHSEEPPPKQIRRIVMVDEYIRFKYILQYSPYITYNTLSWNSEPVMKERKKKRFYFIPSSTNLLTFFICSYTNGTVGAATNIQATLFFDVGCHQVLQKFRKQLSRSQNPNELSQVFSIRDDDRVVGALGRTLFPISTTSFWHYHYNR